PGTELAPGSEKAHNQGPTALAPACHHPAAQGAGQGPATAPGPGYTPGPPDQWPLARTAAGLPGLTALGPALAPLNPGHSLEAPGLLAEQCCDTLLLAVHCHGFDDAFALVVSPILALLPKTVTEGHLQLLSLMCQLLQAMHHASAASLTCHSVAACVALCEQLTPFLCTTWVVQQGARAGAGAGAGAGADMQAQGQGCEGQQTDLTSGQHPAPALSHCHHAAALAASTITYCALTVMPLPCAGMRTLARSSQGNKISQAGVLPSQAGSRPPPPWGTLGRVEHSNQGRSREMNSSSCSTELAAAKVGVASAHVREGGREQRGKARLEDGDGGLRRSAGLNGPARLEGEQYWTRSRRRRMERVLAELRAWARAPSVELTQLPPEVGRVLTEMAGGEGCA
ncbi:hypothetical protein V8C86DRAFT_2673767, partial [Haematococcus lacustris]